MLGVGDDHSQHVCVQLQKFIIILLLFQMCEMTQTL